MLGMDGWRLLLIFVLFINVIGIIFALFAYLRIKKVPK